ncbi:hypothetical protein [Salipiger sp.]|uniref:hypothetical protein n=1 Tax=Salipiger sp. TaxID=2078585 RepID=UPI003A9862D0
MTWLWAISAVIVLLAAIPLLRALKLFLFAFTIAFAALALLHLRHDPAQGAALLATTGGGLAVAWPLRRWFGSLL